jgi:hypothetical protein
MRIALVTLISALTALVAGCSIRVQETELYGVYVAEYENGTETLTLEESGKYVQEVTLQGSDKPVVNSGVWRYHRPSNEIVARVDLKNCLGVNDGFGKIRTDFATNRGGCSFPVARRWLIVGRLRLGPDEASPLWKVK